MSEPAADARPHPVLPAYYRTDADRAGFVQDLFDRTAPHYDRINQVFSLGTGGRYRRDALRRAGLHPGAQVLDVAVGTGLVAREAARVAGPGGGVTGLDVSLGMLAQTRRSLGIPCVQGRAEALPVAESSMDFVSMGYALRHVPDLVVAFREFRRVLRPGGTVLILEIGRPAGRVAYALARLYLGRVVPALCRLATPRGATGTLMSYYWDTIDNCVPAERILAALGEAEFAEVECETALGVFRAFRARRPGPDQPGRSGQTRAISGTPTTITSSDSGAPSRQ